MNNTTILIVGATGTNGQALLKQLSGQGFGVRALVRSITKAADLACEHVELIQGDLANPASLVPALEGMEKAYIVTGIHRDTVKWFDGFYTAAKSAGVRHVVKFSALGASLDSPSTLMRQHGETDRRLTSSGISYTILRPNSFFQNMLWQAQSIIASGLFYLPFGSAKQSMVDVRDLAEVTVRILTEAGHENQVYDFTGPAALSYFDVAACLSEATGKPVSYIPVSIDDAKSAMLDHGMPEWDAQVLTELQASLATQRYGVVAPDLERILGRTPRTFSDFAIDNALVFGA